MANYNPNWSRYNYCRLKNVINKFRTYLSNPSLSENDLYAILYNFYKRAGWRWDSGVDENGTKLFLKQDLENILSRCFNGRDTLKDLIIKYQGKYGNKGIAAMRYMNPFIDEYYKRMEGKAKKAEEKKKLPVQLSLFDENVDKNMKKNIQTINESQLRAIVAESIMDTLSAFGSKAKEYGGKALNAVNNGIANTLDWADRTFNEANVNGEVDALMKQENWFAQATKENGVFILNPHNFSGGANTREMANLLMKCRSVASVEGYGDYSLKIKVSNPQQVTMEQISRMVSESVKAILRENSMDEISFGMARDAFKKSGEELDKMWGDRNIDKSEKDRKLKRHSNLHQHFSDRSRENFDPNMPVIICTTNGVQNMTAGELEKRFDVTGYVEPSQNHIYADQKMLGYPRLRGLIGPMWDGDKLRYEDQETYRMLSM